MSAEPLRQSTDFAEGTEAFQLYQFVGDVLVVEEDEVVALRRRNRLGDLQKVERNGQVHFGEAADFEPADAEERSGSNVLPKQFQTVLFAFHFSSKNENEVGGMRLFGNGKPGLQARRQGAE